MQAANVRVLTHGASHFCGFHDLTPWNRATNELVCLQTSVTEDHVPTHNDAAEIVVVNETTGDITSVSATRAWNWQKGARQRWLPALGRRVVAYNAANEGGFECRIKFLDSNSERILPHPLYDICDDAGFGLTLNFRRLFRCQPGYGYDHPTHEQKIDYKADGIFRVDLETGESQLILSLNDFLHANHIDPNLGEHYFTHIQISPNGKRFAFLHRCLLPSGALLNSFVVAGTDGSSARILLDDKMSHFDWQGIDHVIIWCRVNRAVRQLKESTFLAVARPLYRLSRSIRVPFLRQRLYNESFRELNVNRRESISVGKGILIEDGHPQVNPRYPDIWVTDTYPDAQNQITLMLYSQRTNRRFDLLLLATKPHLKETTWRCDFHPRWHPSGERTCFDSAHLGRRQLCVLDVTKEVREMLDRSRSIDGKRTGL